MPVLPQLQDHTVHFDENGKLVWPVVFMYPEYKVMDFIQEFVEDQRFSHVKITLEVSKLLYFFSFIDHLCLIFETKPDWDVEAKYKPQNLSIYFQDHDTNKVHLIDQQESLENVLKQPWYVKL